MRSTYEIVKDDGAAITIRDLNQGKSVTNDAENVVRDLRGRGFLAPGKRLFYYDSQGDLDEITWTEQGDIGFKIGPR